MRLIDADMIRWTDISENGTHMNYNMCCFKDQIDAMPVIDNKNYISLESLEKFTKNNPEYKDLVWKLADNFFNSYMANKNGVDKEHCK